MGWHLTIRILSLKTDATSKATQPRPLSYLQLRCVPQNESKDAAGTCSATMMVIGGAVVPGDISTPEMVTTILMKKHCV